MSSFPHLPVQNSALLHVRRHLQEAKLKLSHACLEAIDYGSHRGLDKSLIRQLATCRWIAEHQGVIVIGATDPTT